MLTDGTVLIEKMKYKKQQQQLQLHHTHKSDHKRQPRQRKTSYI
jgi:hypothetical protein